MSRELLYSGAVSGPPIDREPARVKAMFGGIAHRYDFLNHLLSLQLDRRWRRRAVLELPPDPGAVVLDLCGGTGDLTVALHKAGRAGLAICADFTHPMLERAVAKFGRLGTPHGCRVVEADALRLPFARESIDAVTVAFGVRNFADMGAGLREIERVLKRSGRLVVLEFSAPTAPVLAPLYRFYLSRVLPRIGDTTAGRQGPYGYLARTIRDFPAPDLLAGTIREAGFAAVGWKALTGGIVCLHTAIKG